MFHFNTEQVIGYWRGLRSGAALPVRQAVDPAGMAELLPQVFMLDLGPATLPFRLAGEFLIDLHGRPLKGVDFQSLFTLPGRRMVARAIEQVMREGEPAVLLSEGFSGDGRSVTLEILLAPLAGADGAPERLLGLYQPTSLVARLAGKPVVELDARLNQPEMMRGPYLKLAAVDGRLIA